MATMKTRMAAALKGEVRADELEAYRRAGGLVYAELEQLEMAADQLPSRRLCTWNAFVLQSIGEHLLDADYAADPSTAGYVPPVTARQVGACFAQVEGWVSRARQSAGNPAYQVDKELRLPADLPEWAEANPCPLPHLNGMLAAARAIRQHAEVALGGFEERAEMWHRESLQRLRQLAAEAATAADYAEGLLHTDPGARMHEAIEQRLQRALELFYHLGQLIAMPTLIASYTGVRQAPASYTGVRQAPASYTGVRQAAPPAQVPKVNPAGFDPWCLTDPQKRHVWQADPRARQAIKEMWDYDPDPAATLRIQAEIDAALRGGAIAFATNGSGQPYGSYYCCPFGAIYLVRMPVVIAGQRLRAMQQFAYEVSAEDVPRGGRFKRELIVATFYPTDEVDYCDPDGLHGG
ncbi:hypothetical protein [Nonomuraea sediminis]|uniref:hypothetical protein n=1 Tax=Nonomuraea sediminis TaxID=2835864 RepID=UPI001BDCF163|nr:hypothetical protein [Nonomuraea sediminis]